jgi:hypothetical protein
MDTFKQKQQLDDMHAAGDTPWAIWKQSGKRAVPKSMRVRASL